MKYLIILLTLTLSSCSLTIMNYENELETDKGSIYLNQEFHGNTASQEPVQQIDTQGLWKAANAYLSSKLSSFISSKPEEKQNEILKDIIEKAKEETEEEVEETVDVTYEHLENLRYHGRHNGDRPTFYGTLNMSDYEAPFTVTLEGCGTLEVLSNNGVRFEKDGRIAKQSDVSGRGMAVVFPSSCKATEGTVEVPR